MNKTNTGASREERLDELLAMAAEAGRLGSEMTSAEATHFDAGAGDPKRRARTRLYAARKAYTAAEQQLNKSRARFVEDLTDLENEHDRLFDQEVDRVRR